MRSELLLPWAVRMHTLRSYNMLRYMWPVPTPQPPDAHGRLGVGRQLAVEVLSPPPRPLTSQTQESRWGGGPPLRSCAAAAAALPPNAGGESLLYDVGLAL